MNKTESELFSTKKERTNWHKSVTVNDITKSITVDKADNDGYIIRLELSGKLNPDKEDSWDCKSKTLISKTNPLETIDDKIDEKMSAIEEMISNNVEFNEI